MIDDSGDLATEQISRLHIQISKLLRIISGQMLHDLSYEAL
jgi:hypothetical protein